MPRDRVERSSPALQAGACTTQAVWAIAIAQHAAIASSSSNYSFVICPVLAVSLSSLCERCCSGDRRFTRDAVGRGSG